MVLLHEAFCKHRNRARRAIFSLPLLVQNSANAKFISESALYYRTYIKPGASFTQFVNDIITGGEALAILLAGNSIANLSSALQLAMKLQATMNATQIAALAKALNVEAQAQAVITAIQAILLERARAVVVNRVPQAIAATTVIPATAVRQGLRLIKKVPALGMGILATVIAAGTSKRALPEKRSREAGECNWYYQWCIAGPRYRDSGGIGWLEGPIGTVMTQCAECYFECVRTGHWPLRACPIPIEGGYEKGSKVWPEECPEYANARIYRRDHKCWVSLPF